MFTAPFAHDEHNVDITQEASPLLKHGTLETGYNAPFGWDGIPCESLKGIKWCSPGNSTRKNAGQYLVVDMTNHHADVSLADSVSGGQLCYLHF
jgi:hypothetical protein